MAIAQSEMGARDFRTTTSDSFEESDVVGEKMTSVTLSPLATTSEKLLPPRTETWTVSFFFRRAATSAVSCQSTSSSGGWNPASLNRKVRTVWSVKWVGRVSRSSSPTRRVLRMCALKNGLDAGGKTSWDACSMTPPNCASSKTLASASLIKVLPLCTSVNSSPPTLTKKRDGSCSTGTRSSPGSSSPLGSSWSEPSPSGARGAARASETRTRKVGT
mmetsp:Transcript_62824/g.148777  ORF Transcript_62824/g.148777 Transcript_62824/m.148777 type:complete len:217 (-) Transcript_62824:1262-1912(-)